MPAYAQERGESREGGRKLHASFGAVGVGLLLLILLLAACSGIGSSTVAEDGLQATAKAMPHYEIEFTLSDDLSSLQGTANIRVPNNSADPWTYLIFPALSGAAAIRRRVQHSERGRSRAAPRRSPIWNRILLCAWSCRVRCCGGRRRPVYLSWRLDIPHWAADTSAAYRPVRLQPGLCEPGRSSIPRWRSTSRDRPRRPGAGGWRGAPAAGTRRSTISPSSSLPALYRASRSR